MEIVELVEPSTKELTGTDHKHAVLRRKTRGEAASSTTYYKIIERDDKHRKRYADHPKDRSKLTCLICGPGHSSYECKVLG